jgi:hypothetical protein
MPMSSVAGLLSLMTVGATVSADDEHGAHVHGVSQLNVAIEGQAVEMEFISPGADIVGFEHVAESVQDRQAVEDAVANLRQGQSLFAFPTEARCRLEEAEVVSGQVKTGHDDPEEHEQAGGGTEHGNEEHAEFRARYRFHCDDPDGLTHMDVMLFELFPATQEIEAQTVTSRGQSAQELTRASTRLTF